MCRTELFIIIIFAIGLIRVDAQPRVTSMEKIENGFLLNVDVKEYEHKILLTDGKTVIDYFEFENPSEPASPKLPSSVFYFAIPPKSTAKVELKNREISIIHNIIPAVNPSLISETDSLYQRVEQKLNSELLRTEFYPENDFRIMGYTWIRDFYCVAVKFNSHIYDWKRNEIRVTTKAELMVTYDNRAELTKNRTQSIHYDLDLSDIILNFSLAEEFRSVPDYSQTDSSGNWIDYSAEYVKLAISSDGLYRINYNDLVEYGVNVSSIDPKTFKIFSKGREQEIYVFGETDNQFDTIDYLEFYAKRNYSELDYRDIVNTSEEYKNYMDRYSDTAIVWLTWGGGNGKRVSLIDNFSSSFSDTLNSHLASIHLENDERLWYYDAVQTRTNLPFYQENKVWTWQTIGSSGSRSFNFITNNFSPDDSVKVVARLISNAADIQINAHKNGLSLNSTSVKDSIQYNYKQTVNFEKKFSTNLLIPGSNTLRIFGMKSDASFQQALIDWVDIEFNRENVALDDSLLIRVNENIHSHPRVIEASGFTVDSESLLIYKIKPTMRRVTNFITTGGTEKTIYFTDTVSFGDEYIIISDQKISKPFFVSKKKFVNLRNNGNGADYILITNRSLKNSSTTYANFINEEYNIRSKVIYVEDIYDEFNFGNKSAESIREFLKYAYMHWTAPAPSYLLLVGEANYDFKHVVKPAPAVRKIDLVPSYGMPVSDPWYVMFDSSNINFPQMYMGRIPVQSDEQLLFYLNKHIQYKSRKFDEWNKTFLFFSGGDPNKPSELDQLKQANDYILNTLATESPTGGIAKHFFKTIDPPSNYGPFPQSEVNSTINDGSIFISYIGHSGTQTWDNGITQVSDLKNKFTDRYSLISDFGCSTGRFAEPDVDAFGESFVSNNQDGQAIAYLGNSSFGYLSTSLLFPKLFYEILLLDSVYEIGRVHNLAKMKMLTQHGASEVNRVFNFCNLLFGDPIIKIKIPDAPNLNVDNSSIEIQNKNPNDKDDSLRVRLSIYNYGKVLGDSLNILITDTWNGNVVFRKSITTTMPYFESVNDFTLPILARIGPHLLRIQIDSANSISELYEDDNEVQVEFIVYSTNIRTLETEPFYNSRREEIQLLNPVSKRDTADEKVTFELSTDKSFASASMIVQQFDSLITTVSLPTLLTDRRYYWRVKVNADTAWSDTYSFVNNSNSYSWFVDSTMNSSDISTDGIIFNSTSKSWELKDKEFELKVISAGSNEGKYASIQINGEEKLTNTFFWGIATAELDDRTLTPKNIRYFVYPSSTSAPQLISYLDSLPTGTPLIMAICDDAAQSVIGYSGGTPVRNAIKNFGSLFIDSVKYRESWCIIGIKGAAAGTVVESYSKLFNGPAICDTNKTVKNDSGKIILPTTASALKWDKFFKGDYLPTGTSITYTPIITRLTGEADTLNTLNLISDSLDLSDDSIFDSTKIQLLVNFKTNDLNTTPQLNFVALNSTGFPEIGVNYQVVSLNLDTIQTGEKNILNFSVYNVGESRADSFNVLVEIKYQDNTKRILNNYFIDSLHSFSKRDFNIEYLAEVGPTNRSFLITIDSENKVNELFEDNNFFEIPFIAKGDTSKPSVKLFVDENEFLNGDFVSPTPTIRAELFDPSLILNNDTASVQLFLDGKRIFNNDADVTFSLNPINPKIALTYKPKLTQGAHEIRFRGFNISRTDTSEILQTVTVSNTLQIISAYNYPNPFNDVTHFTFRLTQIPDELKIKIYTIAGRLVKEMNLNSSQLKYDFNKIFWDGRDADGDLLGNGVYIYKVILKKSDKTETITQKLAIVR